MNAVRKPEHTRDTTENPVNTCIHALLLELKSTRLIRLAGESPPVQNAEPRAFLPDNKYQELKQEGWAEFMIPVLQLNKLKSQYSIR